MPLKLHFLNVGQGDCTIIQFPSGRVGILDMDNLRTLDPDTRKEILEEYHESVDYLVAEVFGRDTSTLDEEFLRKEEEKLTDPLAYYRTFIGGSVPVFRMMVTHPDMDHMTGIHRFFIQEKIKLTNFWHTGDHDFNLAETSEEDWEGSRFDKRDWDTYKKFRRSQSMPTNLHRYQFDQGDFWTQDGIQFWAPTQELEKTAVEKDKPNIISMILKISYQGRNIVLGGDATAEETWPKVYPAVDMKGIDVLKASHHGRKSGFYNPAVKEMSPWLTITSVGEKEHDATDSYRNHSDYTVSLRKAGDIVISIRDDGTLIYPKEIEQYWKPKKT